MKNLKPCPFCGGEAVLKYHKGKTVTTQEGDKMKIDNIKGWWAMGCKTFDCILYYDDISRTARLIFKEGSKKLATERWNRRTEEKHE